MNILFVCTGNTCRSPMAEGLFRTMAAKAGLQVAVKSAGVAAADGMPMSRHAQTALSKRGIKSTFASKLVQDDLIRWADLVLTMTMNHKRALLERFPEAVDKTFTLKEYGQNDNAESAEERLDIERQLADIQLKLALSQPLSKEERSMWMDYAYSAPNYDVDDPFGGSEQQYEHTASELESHLLGVIIKLRNQA